ncbi:globin domain-containing protein [Streptosporangium lutulentum]|uniref:nitric oxide dioxygenase n=1 Tax=Streptosporangium lutulentum TaxID=1461250 RepID=A0ABT9QK26_9ACTN|nr:globin domain-containing protein [Streptosporangium lutulentum]MDP9847111.1 nitric oxide dioxygenase [Streptosporangium lutulentum]
MLSPESTTIVRATLPVVGGAIEDISARFYESMFADNPDLQRNLFNRGNQANGEQRSALAGSIAAFATLLVERPEVRPDTMLSRIANKHASLGIAPEQYVVVHKYLFGAIAEVLGDAVTPEVARAWDEVYWLMANALIALEARLLSNTVEGWTQATVLQRQEQSADAISFTLRPSIPLSFKPGQYISVAVTLPDGARQIRQYSLSSAPERDDWRITVKRVRGGDTPEGEVSNWLHANVRAGDVLTVSAPFGDLTLPPGDTPLLLASAGIGATPILSMVEHLAATGSTRPVTVVHADRAPADHAHREELTRLVDDLPDATLHRWYETPCEYSCSPAPNVGTVDLAGVDLPDRVVAYLCGPLPFMRGVRSQLLRRGVPASDIHYEVFGPDLWLGRD